MPKKLASISQSTVKLDNPTVREAKVALRASTPEILRSIMLDKKREILERAVYERFLQRKLTTNI